MTSPTYAEVLDYARGLQSQTGGRLPRAELERLLSARFIGLVCPFSPWTAAVLLLIRLVLLVFFPDRSGRARWPRL